MSFPPSKQTPEEAPSAVTEVQAGASASAEELASPCVSICSLDENDVCLGCYRSAAEITDWFMADAQEKREILARAAARRADDGSVRLL